MGVATCGRRGGRGVRWCWRGSRTRGRRTRRSSRGPAAVGSPARWRRRRLVVVGGGGSHERAAPRQTGLSGVDNVPLSPAAPLRDPGSLWSAAWRRRIRCGALGLAWVRGREGGSVLTCSRDKLRRGGRRVPVVKRTEERSVPRVDRHPHSIRVHHLEVCFVGQVVVVTGGARSASIRSYETVNPANSTSMTSYGKHLFIPSSALGTW